MTKTIEITKDLYDFLEAKSKFGETPNDVISRIVGLGGNSLPAQEKNKRTRIVKLHSKGVEFWEGMKLRAVFKGREYHAQVINGNIVYNGKKFNSPSAAAMEICGHEKNGWDFWSFFEETTNKWRSIDDLRK